MRKTIYIFLAFLPILVYAQERKSYKGKYYYEGRSYDVEYEYIETKNGRVFDGHCSIDKGNYEGNFKNGLKDGVWTDQFKQGKRTYINGKLNGPREWDGTVQIWYKNNHFAGSFDFGDYSGQFDSDGYADGEWISYGIYNGGVKYTRTQKWEHGYLISDIVYDESTGQKKDLVSPIFNKFEERKYYSAEPRFLGDERSWWLKSYDGGIVTETDGTAFRVRYFQRGGGVYDGLILGYYRNNCGEYLHTMGEYCMTVFPFIGIKLPLTKEEQGEINRKKEENRKAKEEMDKWRRDLEREKEKERVVQEEREKKIQEAITIFDNSLYGKLLSKIRSNMAKGKTLEELKKEFIPSEFKCTPVITTEEPKPRIIKIPIIFGISDNQWVEIRYLYIYDYSVKAWTKSINNALIKCNYGNIIYLDIPGVFFESDEFDLKVNEKEELLIVQKTNGKQENSEIVKPLAIDSSKDKKGFYYSIKNAMENAIDPMTKITIEELNKTTRSRVEKSQE